MLAHHAPAPFGTLKCEDAGPEKVLVKASHLLELDLVKLTASAEKVCKTWRPFTRQAITGGVAWRRTSGACGLGAKARERLHDHSEEGAHSVVLRAAPASRWQQYGLAREGTCGARAMAREQRRRSSLRSARASRACQRGAHHMNYL